MKKETKELIITILKEEYEKQKRNCKEMDCTDPGHIKEQDCILKAINELSNFNNN